MAKASIATAKRFFTAADAEMKRLQPLVATQERIFEAERTRYHELLGKLAAAKSVRCRWSEALERAQERRSEEVDS